MKIWTAYIAETYWTPTAPSDQIHFLAKVRASNGTEAFAKLHDRIMAAIATAPVNQVIFSIHIGVESIPTLHPSRLAPMKITAGGVRVTPGILRWIINQK
jgi:hypothetical protein